MKHVPNGLRILGPRPDLGYFPRKSEWDPKEFPIATTVEECERAFKKILRPFSKRAIAFLKTRLERGTVNGSANKKDLFATLARAVGVKSDLLRASAKKDFDAYRFVDYWFFQIPPKFIAGEQVYDRCIFTEHTVQWCDEILREKHRSRKSKLRRRSHVKTSRKKKKRRKSGR